MPTNRKRIKRQIRGAISDNVRHYLESGEADSSDIEIYMLEGNREHLRDKWETLKEGIMADWIDRHHCTRPFAWYEFESTGPRLMIGGHGRTMTKKYAAWKPYFNKGIPASWSEIEPDNPPLFESEAVFLQRNGLLSESEKRYLSKHPALMVPVKIKD